MQKNFLYRHHRIVKRFLITAPFRYKIRGIYIGKGVKTKIDAVTKSSLKSHLNISIYAKKGMVTIGCEYVGLKMR